MRGLILVAVAIGLAASSTVCLASDWREIGAACGAGARYLPTTCDCLAHKLPNTHLIGGVGPDACTFRDPPASFDPSRAPTAVLENWGIDPSDARYLGDPDTRAAFYRAVRRFFNGIGCNGRTCGPAMVTQSRYACKLPDSLMFHCVREGPRLPGPDLIRGVSGKPSIGATVAR